MRATLRCAIFVVVVTLFDASGAAAARPDKDYPTLSLCVPAQLNLRVGGARGTRYNTRTHQWTHEVLIRAVVQNVTPIPCYLSGTPRVSLRHSGRALDLRYQSQRSPITSAFPLSSSEQILWPKATAQLGVTWFPPWCGRDMRVALRVDLVVGQMTSPEVIPTPRCLRGSGVVMVEPWFVTP